MATLELNAPAISSRLVAVLRSPGLLASYLWVLVIVLAAIHPGLFVSGDPLQQDASQIDFPALGIRQ